jgi:hypothetical protein
VVNQETAAIKDKALPCEPAASPKIGAFSTWYELNKKQHTPYYIGSNYNRTLVDYPSFINGNGKVSRLIMNGILLSSIPHSTN